MQLLVSQLIALQRKNLLLARRGFLWCICQWSCALLLVFLSIIAFFFIQNPFEAVPAETWEASSSVQRLTPLLLQSQSVFPIACFPFDLDGAAFFAGPDYEEGMGRDGPGAANWRAVEPFTAFADEELKRSLFNRGYEFLQLDQLYIVYKMAARSAQIVKPRSTVGLVGASSQQIWDKLLAMDKARTSIVKPLYNLFAMCDINTQDCKDMLKCFVQRVAIIARQFFAGVNVTSMMNQKEDCSQSCYDDVMDTRWTNYWSSFQPLATKVLELALDSGARLVSAQGATMPGCATDQTASASIPIQMSGDLSAYAVLLLTFINGGSQCNARPTGGRRLEEHGVDSPSASSAKVPISDSATKTPSGTVVPGFFRMLAKVGAVGFLPDLFNPRGMLHQHVMPQIGAESSLRRIEASRSPTSSLQLSGEEGNAKSSGRRLRADCGMLQTKCDCATEPYDCGWEGEECRRSREFEKAYTSCWECPTQIGCSKQEIDTRAIQIMDVLVPTMRIFSDTQAFDDHVTGEMYGQVTNVSGIQTTNAVCAGIVLEKPDCLTGNGDCSYVLRLNTSGRRGGAALGKTSRLEELRGSGYSEQMWSENLASTCWRDYFQQGFINLQYAMDDYLLNPTTSPNSDPPKSWFSFVPFPRYAGTVWKGEVQQLFSGNGDGNDFGAVGMVSFSVIVIAFPIVSRALREKEEQLRDGMRMMGLSNVSYYISHYLWAATWAFLPCLLMTLLFMITPTKTCTQLEGSSEEVCELNIGALFRNTNFFWIFLLFFFGVLANVSLGMMIVPLVGRARTGRVLTPALMYFLIYVLFSEPTTMSGYTLCAFAPCVAVLQGVRVWILLEDIGIGLTTSTLSVPIAEYSFSISIWMLFIDIVLYFAVYWYLDQVAPYGSAHRPFYFLFTKEYWQDNCGREVARRESQSLIEEGGNYGGAFEAPSAACLQLMQEGKTLEVRGLQKVFKAQGRTIAAVDGVDFSMYPGEIYVLLGHNGAGKTTSINCLTGLMKSTGGSARLFGQSLWSLLKSTAGRKQIGICPQHNVLYRELTCLEHVTLFGNFRGLKQTEARTSGLEILQDSGLGQNLHKYSQRLSGGMKRKLCLAIALVGDPRLCFLDEPSSGMDPTARRDTWDLLRRKKEGRIVVLTTHYMDEADILGDRIGIMAHGQLQCLGSSLFLKQHYGCGYNLTLEISDESKKKEVTQLIQRELGGETTAKVLSSSASELTMLVDFSGSRMFPNLFAQLDNTDVKERLTIRHWSIAVCHLEEVFLKVAAGTATDTAAEETKAGLDPSSGQPQAAVVGSAGEGSAMDGDVDADLKPRIHRQMGVMLQKRARYMMRDPTLLFCQLLCPGVALAVIVIIMISYFSVPERLDLSLDMFNDRLDSGSPRTIMPHSGITASMASLGASTVSMGFADQSPLMSLDPSQSCRADGSARRVQAQGQSPGGNSSGGGGTAMRPGMNTYGGNWAKQCKPDGEQGTGNLFQYMHSFGCQLMSTNGAQEASRYVAVFPVAAETSGATNMVILANLTGVHIAPIAANVASNVLRHKAGKGKVNVATHPLPTTKVEKDQFFGGEGLTITLALLLPTFVFPFPIAFAAAYVIREKETGVKSQHLMSGVGVTTYWFACIFADIVIFALSIALALIPLAAAGVDALLTGEVILTFIVFSFAQVPFGYLIGSLCHTAASAQNVVLAFNMGVTFVFGTAGLIIRSINVCWEPKITVMPSVDDGCTMSLSDWLDPIIRTIPGVALSEALHMISSVNTLIDSQIRSPEWYAECERELALYARSHWACAETPLSFGAAGGPLLWMGLEAIAFILLIIINDWTQLHPKPRTALHYKGPAVPKPEGWEDEDVLAEAGRMPSPKEVAVHVKGVRKVYGPTLATRFCAPLQCCRLNCVGCCCEDFCSCFKCKRPVEVHAVKGVDFTMAYGEVFGLLGTNGAGKSTLFNMIAGYSSPNDGAIHVSGMDMATGPGSRGARQRTGYCPQENALLEMMTAREHLVFYSNLKGLPGHQVASVSEAKLQQFGLKPFEHNYAANLSGGNKRKLMAACALIGDPPIILADEPSAGMDPVARRFMWGMIKNVATRRKRSSVLLSTHSMEECEALCSRSAIMVNGVFRCLGTNNSICERYGGGFDLMVKVERPSQEEMTRLITSLQLAEDHRLDLQWATATIAAQNNEFLAAALKGKGSPYADPRARVSPAVFVEWWIYATRFHALHAFAPKVAESVELVDWHSPMARYKLKSKKGLGSLFAMIEANKQTLKVLEYSISATTLEQIFNNFARHQDAAETDGDHGQKVTSFAAADLQDYIQIAQRTPLPQDTAALNLEPVMPTSTPIPQDDGKGPAVVSLGEAADTPRTGVESVGDESNIFQVPKEAPLPL